MFANLLPPPAKFVNRKAELETLASHLLPGSEGPGLAFVHGPVGIGKTALVAEFAYRHLTKFPAGVQYLPSFGTELPRSEEAGRAAEIAADHSEPQSDGLVVIEEVGNSDPIGVGTFVQTLRARRPLMRFILTSQLPLPMPDQWLNIPLDGISQSELAALLQDQDIDEEPLALLTSRAAGNPLLTLTIANLVRRGEPLEQLLARLDPVTYPGLLGPDGQPLDPSSKPPYLVHARLRAVDADLVERVRRNPDEVHSLSPREFEEFVAALYKEHGFEVELTPPSRDGGVDLYAVRYEPFGKVLTVVECKRHAPNRPVGVEMVRSLRGAIDDHGASVGVLATTSSFTAGAKTFQQRHSFRLALQDWFDLQDMMDGSS